MLRCIKLYMAVYITGTVKNGNGILFSEQVITRNHNACIITSQNCGTKTVLRNSAGIVMEK